jgi:sarcosine oxidase gamma subunit
LEWLFPTLRAFDFPKIQMQAVGRGGNLQLTGKLTLAHPLPPLEKWRVPTGTIHPPLVSFTAARGVGPWLAKQGWMRPWEIQPPPDQFFVWAQAQIPFQTYAAEPVPDAKAALAQLDHHLSATASSQGNFFTSFTRTNENDEISWRGLPFIMPFVQAVREPAGDFLVGGFFQNPPKGPPPPWELLVPLNQTNLVYYHWEATTGRLKELPQLSQLLLVLTRHEQVNAESAAGKWLDRIEPALGKAVTEVTQTAPNELAFKRTAGGGLTALELLALVDWLEAPKFPALDLRVPPPRVRPGQKPLNLLSTPAAPASHP